MTLGRAGDIAGAPGPSRAAGARSARAQAARWISAAPYLQKWIVLGVAIGTVAGLGAVVFYEALQVCTHLFLGILAGYRVPTPFGEGNATGSASPARAWALPLVIGLGALLGGILVYLVAPETAGHGTDAAISAVHDHPRGVRFRAVVVKLVASALTIGSGGSGGREGPAAQISAGFGSLLSRLLDLEPADARVAVGAGIGSGIGSTFGAPLGGDVLASEILYRDDLDPAVLLPSFVASAVGYVVFGGIEGFTPLFGFTDYRFTDPIQLGWFALIGLLGGLIGLLYAKSFYGMERLFTRGPLPHWANPAVGGVLVGAMALAVPQVLGTGYGWVQQGLGNRLMGIPLWVVLILPVARIVATGLSIGSGGSGGLFGPGLVIGAFVGAAVWRLFDPLVPSMGHSPAPYVIVGMMCCFGGISRAPLAVMVMAAEMTGSLSILGPAMVGVGISWLVVRRVDDSIYRSQLHTRSDAAAHPVGVGLPPLATFSVAQAMAPPRLVVGDRLSAVDASRALAAVGVTGAPVVDREGRFEGTVILQDLAAASGAHQGLRGLVDAGAPTVTATSTLDVAVHALTTSRASFVPVVDDERRVLGTLAVSDLARACGARLRARLRAHEPPGTAVHEIEADPGSPVAGRRLRDAALPDGVVVMAIQRHGVVLTPTGDTVIEPGDLLSVIGGAAGGENGVTDIV